MSTTQVEVGIRKGNVVIVDLPIPVITPEVGEKFLGLDTTELNLVFQEECPSFRAVQMSRPRSVIAEKIILVKIRI